VESKGGSAKCGCLLVTKSNGKFLEPGPFVERGQGAARKHRDVRNIMRAGEAHHRALERSEHSTPPSAWIVVNTQPHREQIALENLARQAFNTYCPMMRTRVRHARRAQEVLRPLFPGYLFVRVNSDLQRWRPILSTYGVRTLVCCGDCPSFLDGGFVEALQAREMGGAIVRPASPYAPGQRVKMAGGAFDGLIATILEMDEKDRLVVLMDLLNRPTKVRVDARRVIPA
jgi:transcriptional antiterminator RfaH